MKNTKLAAMKLRTAMSGLKTAYRDAAPSDRKVILATMKEIQSIQTQIAAAEEAEADDMEAEGMLDDMESAAEDMPAGESAEDMGMDESVDEMGMDDAADLGDMGDMGMDEMSDVDMGMDEAHMSESDMMDEEMPPSMDMEETAEVDGIEVPEDFLGELDDLGLIDIEEGGEDMGDMGEEMPSMEAEGEESGSEDEELAVAALTLAANALKALKAEADEPESAQEEGGEEAERKEHKATLDEGDILALQEEGLMASASARKLREISARLLKVSSKVGSPKKAVASPLAARSARRQAR